MPRMFEFNNPIAKMSFIDLDKITHCYVLEILEPAKIRPDAKDYTFYVVRVCFESSLEIDSAHFEKIEEAKSYCSLIATATDEPNAQAKMLGRLAELAFGNSEERKNEDKKNNN